MVVYELKNRSKVEGERRTGRASTSIHRQRTQHPLPPLRPNNPQVHENDTKLSCVCGWRCDTINNEFRCFMFGIVDRRFGVRGSSWGKGCLGSKESTVATRTLVCDSVSESES